MKKLRKLLLSIFLAFSIFMLGSCGSGQRTLAKVKASKELVVATNCEFAPFEYKEGTKYLGIEIDIIRGYAEHIGVKCKIEDQDFDATFLSVYTNKADIGVSGYTVTEKRMKRYDFSNPTFNSSQLIVVKKDSKYATFTDKESILAEFSKDKIAIGCQRGTTGEYFIGGDADWGFDGISGTTLVSYDNGALACKALSNGTISAVIIDGGPAKAISKKYSDLVVLDIVLTEEEYAFLFSKGNDTLRNSVNEYLDIIKASGEMDRIIEKYYA